MEHPEIKNLHDRIVFSPERYQLNMKAIDGVRSTASILSGVCAGILRCTSLYGLVAFLAFYVLTSALLLLPMGMDSAAYTNRSLVMFALGDMSKYGLSFVLFWTLAYGLVYIY